MKTFGVWVALLLCGIAPLANAGGVEKLDRATASLLVDEDRYSQPTVVALWSLDCSHCKRYLKELGELSRGNDQVQIITVAVEPWHEEHGAVLDELNTGAQRYAYGDEVPAVLGYALDPAWHGELPRALFFDGQGNKEARSGRLSMDAVKQLLAVEVPVD